MNIDDEFKKRFLETREALRPIFEEDQKQMRKELKQEMWEESFTFFLVKQFRKFFALCLKCLRAINRVARNAAARHDS